MNWRRTIELLEHEARAILAKCGAPADIESLAGYQARDRLELNAQLVILGIPHLMRAAEIGNINGALDRLLSITNAGDDMRILAAIPEYKNGIFLFNDGPNKPKSEDRGYVGIPDIINDARRGRRKADTQRKISQLPRGKLRTDDEEETTTISEIIRALAGRKDAWGEPLPAKELWGELYSELDQLGLDPREAPNRADERKGYYEYDGPNGRKRLTLGSFIKEVSKARNLP